MKYSNIHRAEFVSRPNRFIACAELDGEAVVCHVKNTGRCKELLVPDSEVYLTESNNPARKTKYDLVAVNKNGQLFNIDSQAPNIAAGEYLKKNYPDALIRPETKFGNSRFDFYIENGDEKIIVEVKGVTLEKDGVALFPDAPTERGVKHIKELTEYAAKGYKTQILFVIQTENISSFSPNDVTHKAFGDALRTAKQKGVTVTAVNCSVTPDSMEIKNDINVVL
ncbi:MAG: DNA/RNA nuclease SfsA [Clostridia bacterium]|nr:DNA/RNA nuclease SfsA [Clostridia bacterium]